MLDASQGTTGPFGFQATLMTQIQLAIDQMVNVAVGQGWDGEAPIPLAI